jgi:hypothetical protein
MKRNLGGERRRWALRRRGTRRRAIDALPLDGRIGNDALRYLHARVARSVLPRKRGPFSNAKLCSEPLHANLFYVVGKVHGAHQ